MKKLSKYFQRPVPTYSIVAVVVVLIIWEWSGLRVIRLWVLQSEDLEKLAASWVFIVQIFCCVMLGLTVLSLLFEFKHGGDCIEPDTNVTLKSERYWHLHWHGTYTKIAALGITFTGLIYTVYSDVFYQHGNPVTPVLYGLIDNATETRVNSELLATDTTHLVFLLDVSASTKKARNENTQWVDSVIMKLKRETEPRDKSTFSPKRESWIDTLKQRKEKSDTFYTGLDLIKYKACQAIMNSKEAMDRDGNHKYIITVAYFGRKVEYIEERLNPLVDSFHYKELLLKIVDYKYQSSQMDSTNYLNLFNSVLYYKLAMGSREKFKSQKNVISLIGDFRLDKVRVQDTIGIKRFLFDVANSSSYFNFILVNRTVKDSAHSIDVLPLFERVPSKTQFQTFSIDKPVREIYTYYKAEKGIVFIVDELFHVGSQKTTLKVWDSDSIIPITFDDGKEIEDEWQEYELNDTPIIFNYQYFVKQGSQVLTFKGHVPTQFPSVKADIYFSSRKTVISSEVFFKKGLKLFIAKLIVWIGLYLFYFSTFYIIYLIIHGWISYQRTSDKRELLRSWGGKKILGLKSFFLKKNKTEQIKTEFKQIVTNKPDTVPIRDSPANDDGSEDNTNKK